MASGATAPASISGGNSALFFSVAMSCGATALTADTARAQLDVEGADEVHECGLGRTVCDVAGLSAQHPAVRPTWMMTPEPFCSMWGCDRLCQP